MATPKIQLNPKLQEMIACNQEDNCDAARARIEFLDDLISKCIHGVDICFKDENSMKFLQELDCIRQDYKSFIIEE